MKSVATVDNKEMDRVCASTGDLRICMSWLPLRDQHPRVEICHSDPTFMDLQQLVV